MFPSFSTTLVAGIPPASAEATYGCEANPTGNPIGGGDGYSDIYLSGDFHVTSRQELTAALAAAEPGQVVFIPAGADIDLSGQRTLSIPPA